MQNFHWKLSLWVTLEVQVSSPDMTWLIQFSLFWTLWKILEKMSLCLNFWSPFKHFHANLHVKLSTLSISNILLTCLNALLSIWNYSSNILCTKSCILSALSWVTGQFGINIVHHCSCLPIFFEHSNNSQTCILHITSPHAMSVLHLVQFCTGFFQAWYKTENHFSVLKTCYKFLQCTHEDKPLH